MVENDSKPKAGPISRAITWLTIIGIIGGLLFLAREDAQRSRLLPEGEPAPPFALEKYGGGTARLEDYRGKVVMLDFWATWCRPCIEELPSLVKLAQEYEAKGLVFVAANNDDPDEAKAAVGIFIDQKIPALGKYAAFADGPTTAGYKMKVMPTLYFIDRQGRVIDAHVGAASESKLRRWIEAALAR